MVPVAEVRADAAHVDRVSKEVLAHRHRHRVGKHTKTRMVLMAIRYVEFASRVIVVFGE